MVKKSFFTINMLVVVLASSTVLAQESQLDLKKWKLEWSDEFNYKNSDLENNWISQNGATENEWVLSSRWRENAVVKNGVLELLSKKETRAESQPWTTGNIWSKRTFHYGYFEARYKYAGAYGTNNSFWLWPKQGVAAGQKACEIDINEGHYPNIINTNVHNWTDTYTLPNGQVSHDDNQLHHTLDGEPGHNIVLKAPIKTTKIRLRSTSPESIHIHEFQVFPPATKYPNVMSPLDSTSVTNYALAKDTNLKTSGVFDKLPSKESFAIDNRLDTRWVSGKHGLKWLELSWDTPKEIGAIQFTNGWLQESGPSLGKYRNLITDYTLEYFDGKKWKLISQYDAADVADYSSDWHTYGMAWDQDYFHFYMDGKLYYSMRNDVCFSEQTILFSLAILKAEIAGPVTDAINGTSMKIDYVRYYTRKK
ncbi:MULTISPECIES: family 16 glycosylhydrolase [unclassified Cellvibrio]|uniref:family 16 glycosylhydrolase n=1 Tax=unclassified Cellvibrio TaxID=2624793 RepID=UPI001CD9A3F2|nr:MULTISPECIES: family 16 glycosylhydrolase [unclassified Cellvibrio]UUA73805.1 family 16 glycosylhydrolase [Cellvibrio sp. QJXJ]